MGAPPTSDYECTRTRGQASGSKRRGPYGKYPALAPSNGRALSDLGRFRHLLVGPIGFGGQPYHERVHSESGTKWNADERKDRNHERKSASVRVMFQQRPGRPEPERAG